MTLYLLKYNNYYNRFVKKERTVAGYADKADILGTITNVSFIPGDDITTTQIINYTPAANEMPDYLLVVDELDNIISRWYVINAVRTRRDQYNLSLLRDLVADWYSDILNAPCFIEKAMLGINDPGIFNNENMSYNQIKTSETPIKDLTNSAWYVGYLNKEFATTEDITIPKGTDIIAGTYSNKEAYPYSVYQRNGSAEFLIQSDLTLEMWFRNHLGISWVVGWDVMGNPKTPTKGIDGELFTGLATSAIRNKGFLSGEWTHSASQLGQGVLDVVSLPVSVDWTTGVAAAAKTKTENERIRLLAEQGKIYQMGEEYYQVMITSVPQARTTWNFSNDSVAAQNFLGVAKASGELDTSDISGNFSGFEMTPIRYYVELIPYSLSEYKISIPLARNQTMDSPWDLFCIPYHAVAHGNLTSSPEMSKRVVDALIRSLTDAEKQMYDIQVLPFCPLDDYFIDESEVLLDRMPNGESTNYIQIGEGLNNTLMVFCSSSNIKKRLDKYPLEMPTKPIEFKVANECDMYRIVSPNYNGQFEFSVVKNGGLNGYNITMSCKPHSPYIKVAPIFGRLYGQDFGDARGLICGGDFSLSRLNNAWTTYELNNKNYQIMFDRQIQNIEVNNAIQRELEMWNIGFGAGTGTGTGAMAGNMIGGGYGAIAGAAIGGIVSGIGGALDYRLNEKLRAEALDYTKDQFGYQLGNIKAMPSSLAKVSALNADNKLFPILEYYTCSETEKQALRDKITYNGMTVMRIGRLADFVPRRKSKDTYYLKGKIIRLDGLNADTHIANAIANEINQGVFINNEYSK